MKKFLLILTLLLSAKAGAQDINELLQRIETNNLTLKALREQAEADKLGNRKGIALPDPEIEAGRLWGRPSEIGNRVDFSISQSIDLATLSGARLRAAKRRNELIDLGLLTQRTAILLQAKQAYIEFIYTEKWQDRRRGQDLADLWTMGKRKFAEGEISQMELNRLQIAYQVEESLANEILNMGWLALDELSILNGGESMYTIAGAPYPADTLHDSDPDTIEPWFDSIVDCNPAVVQARREVEVSAQEVGLARAEGLPKLKVGYMQERTLGQRYGGVTAGLSIPLWSNRNNVRAAKASAAAVAARQTEVAMRVRQQLMLAHERARRRHGVWERARQALEQADNTALMRKALDAGEISMTDYLLDRQQYYELQDKALEAERDYHLALSELMSFEL